MPPSQVNAIVYRLLLAVLVMMGLGSTCPADLDGNGIDLAILLASWG